ncbi:histone-like nucleoid-structuring protein Lsr2 [Agrococcus baldri]|uniref:Nucleoid-associated protein Lsr2 n=1 Tax=Agrococcus baldri TaxID=153730 RepID=A0AA87RAU7_9MICO|nr:Lsr2 family protein [Agrococcus baldri]GEK79684.1 nucleoid-associated protein Lsr2 [Agrococcus baldri]
MRRKPKGVCGIFSAMAKKTFVQLVDDFSGESISDGEGRTVRFAFDGAEYEIDLTNEHVEEFSDVLERYVRASRRVSGRRKTGGSPARSGGNSETAAIREWAESQGLKVATRGRIPAEIVEQYRNR